MKWLRLLADLPGLFFRNKWNFQLLKSKAIVF